MKIYKPQDELSQHEKMRGDFKVLWPMVKEALHRRVWLYHKQTGEWLTPEEFLEKYKRRQMSNYEVSQLQKCFILRDPRDGNTAYHRDLERKIQIFQEQMDQLREKGEAFLSKVIDYYRKD